VLGEFPDQGDDTLIKLSDIEAATKGRISGSSIIDTKGVGAGFKPAPTEEKQISISIPVSDDVVIAVDMARFGSDRSVILRRRGCRVEEIRTFQGMDTMQLAGGVAAAIQESRPDQVYIDEVGVGAGVVDRLREQGYQVRGINVARAARQSSLFANLRAEGYWRLRELFTAGQISLPSDNQLMG
jgi:hypothetical protein